MWLPSFTLDLDKCGLKRIVMSRRDCMVLQDGNKRRLAFSLGRGSLRSCSRGSDLAGRGKARPDCLEIEES